MTSSGVHGSTWVVFVLLGDGLSLLFFRVRLRVRRTVRTVANAAGVIAVADRAAVVVVVVSVSGGGGGGGGGSC